MPEQLKHDSLCNIQIWLCTHIDFLTEEQQIWLSRGQVQHALLTGQNTDT